MNTPLPMVITGVLIADLAVGETLRDLRLYFTAFVRLAVLPLVMLGLMLLAGVPAGLTARTPSCSRWSSR